MRKCHGTQFIPAGPNSLANINGIEKFYEPGVIRFIISAPILAGLH